MNRLIVPGFRLAVLMLLFLCVSSSANAQQVEQGDARFQSASANEEHLIIDAVVSEVQGTILKLEGGLSVDISKALVFQITAAHLDPSLIKPGTCIPATATFSVDPSAPLQRSLSGSACRTRSCLWAWCRLSIWNRMRTGT